MPKIFIIVVAALVIAGGGGYYFFSTSHAANGKNSTSAEKRDTVTEGSFVPDIKNNLSGTGSFKSLFGLKQNVMCTISYKPENYSAIFNGTVYIAGDKMRAEISSEGGEAGAIDTSVIRSDGEMYVWGKTSVGDMAMKFKDDETQKATSSNSSFNLDEQVTYSCKDTEIDASKFVPPAEIKFQDRDAMMQMVPKASAAGSVGINKTGLQCSSCNQIPDAGAKAQCLQALSCN